MQICNYTIKTVPLNPAEVDNGLPLSTDAIFNIKGNFTLRIYGLIQLFIWDENRVPELQEIATIFNITTKKVEKNIESLHKQDALMFFIKE